MQSSKQVSLPQNFAEVMSCPVDSDLMVDNDSNYDFDSCLVGCGFCCLDSLDDAKFLAGIYENKKAKNSANSLQTKFSLVGIWWYAISTKILVSWFFHIFIACLQPGVGRSSEVEHSLMVRWVVGSILHGVDPLSYFSFQPVLHDWCNKGRGMCYPVWDCAYKRTLAVNR